MSERTVALYANDIREAIERIEAYTKSLSFEDFRHDEKTIDAVVRNIEVIGEASRHIPDTIRLQYPTIPWKQIVGSRDKMIHEYFGVDLDVLWKTVTEDLSALKQQVENLLKDLV